MNGREPVAESVAALFDRRENIRHRSRERFEGVQWSAWTIE